MTPDREHLIARIQEFDHTDDYHLGDVGETGYYDAIDRVVRLLRGEITDWRSPKP